MIRKSFLTICLLGAFSIVAHAQTVDEIIQKNIEARGGYDKLKSVQSYRVTGKSIFQGMEAPYTLIQKRPNKMHLEISLQGQKMVQAYDGETAWWIVPFTGSTDPQVMPEQQAKSFINQADIDGHLVDYKDKGHKVELVGKEKMEGTDVYKLKITLNNGDEMHAYLDAEHFLELKYETKVEQQGNEVTVETYMSDYKQKYGLVIPHAMETRVGGNTVMQITVETVELNVKPEDALFEMPKAQSAK